MPQNSIEVIGNGFVPGIPGIFANTTIPSPTPDDADISLSLSDPAQPAQTTNTASAQPKRKAQTAKVINQE